MMSSPKTVKCGLCSILSTTFHCNTCRINLCKTCVTDHISSQHTTTHNIVAYELRDTSIKHPDCPSHSRYKCELYCQKCNLPVCSQCCAEDHLQHRVKDITNIYEHQIYNIKQDLIKIEQFIVPEYQRIIKSIENRIQSLQSEYLKLRTSVSDLGKKWHKEVDNIIHRYESELKKKEADDVVALTQHRSDIEKSLIDVKQALQKYNDLLKSNDGLQLIHFRSRSENLRKIPKRLHVVSPDFTAKTFSQDSLYQQFGILTASDKSLLKEYIVKILLPEVVTVVVSQFQGLSALRCTENDEVWIGQHLNGTLKRINIDGSLQQKISSTFRHSSRAFDIAVTIHGHLTFSDVQGDGGVYQVKCGVIESYLNLKNWKPRGICSTSEGDLLVCMIKNQQSKVVRFRGFTVKQEIMNDNNGQPLYGTGGLFVTENTNKQVWVSDSDKKSVVVTNQLGTLKFKYAGNPEPVTHNTFSPWKLDSDSRGHVLVIDISNSCVHIVDNTGHLLCYICDLNNPVALSVDSNDRVWIGEHVSGDIKIVKYLQ